jgi:two-component system sensor histidine kinase TctE
MNDTSYSLRRQLLVRLFAPLFIVLTLGGVATFGIARHIGSIVYDRWLYDSAMTLAEQIKLRDNQLVLDVSKAALEMFEWDKVDRIYEEVISRDRGRIFGNAKFSAPPQDMRFNQPRFSDGVIDAQPVRVVTLMMSNPAQPSDIIFVQVAETRHKRGTLVMETIVLSMPLQLGLLLVAGVFIWLAVASSLRTLDGIAARLASYEPETLVPVHDVEKVPSEVKPLVNSINQLIGKLSIAQNTQRRFVANAAHQLRTPLATLQVQTERALREPDPVKHVEALSHVFAAVTRLRHVVHQILTLARSDHTDHTSRQVLGMVQVDLAELARLELERWADAAIARNIDLGYDGPETGTRILGDPLLLHELIGNLVDNAIRYGREGGEVTLRLFTSPPTLCVDDDGPGIPAEERAFVVERFYRRAEATDEGCGLGLAIALEIAARHGAQLHIVDSPSATGIRVMVIFQAVE